MLCCSTFALLLSIVDKRHEDIFIQTFLQIGRRGRKWGGQKMRKLREEGPTATNIKNLKYILFLAKWDDD